MDDDANLIARLLTLAGTIMEDASTVAIVNDGTRSIEQRVAEIAVAAMDIESLARAVELIRRLAF